MHKKQMIFCWACILLGEQYVRCQLAPVQKEAPAWIKVLEEDARLDVDVDCDFVAPPTVVEVLALLHKATGVRLSPAEQMDRQDACFGSVTAIEVPAWKVMEQLALNQVIDGKWEKSGDGYVLHGRPRNWRQGGGAEELEPKSPEPIKWWIFAIPAVAVLFVAGGLYLIRSRASKAGPKDNKK
jgi:hypothetical protein